MSSFPRKRAPIAVVAAGAGDTAVVAGVAGKRIAVMGYVIVASAAGVNPKWRSNTTDISGAMPFAANGGVVVPLSPDDPWLITAAGETLNLNAAGVGNVGGHVVYEERPY
jgi:hypothetical protein